MAQAEQLSTEDRGKLLALVAESLRKIEPEERLILILKVVEALQPHPGWRLPHRMIVRGEYRGPIEKMSTPADFGLEDDEPTEPRIAPTS
jgi:hypothetical protein